MDPAPSPSGSGHGTGTSLSAASRPGSTWTPHLAVCNAVADPWASVQAVPAQPSRSRFRPAGFCTFFFSGATKRWSMNCFSSHELVFCRAREEPFGDLATPLDDGQTSWVYCITLVQSLFISCYVSLNKLVLSHLLLRLRPQCCFF
jgi:hypothetical protein